MRAAQFRARRLEWVLRMAPLIAGCNIFNALLVLWAFWPVTSHALLLGWFALVACATASGVPAWRRLRRGRMRTTASRRTVRKALWQAVALACLWALVPVLLVPGADPPRLAFGWIVTVGMICAGGFALTTMPRAGTAYVLVMLIGGAIGLWRSDSTLAPVMSVMLLLYSGIAIGGVWMAGRYFGERLHIDAEAEHKTQLISLLLRDFEENASDVLWETDLRGHFCHVTDRLQQLFQMDAARLTSMPVFELVETMQPERRSDRAATRALRDTARRLQPSRDLLMPLQVGGRLRWWSLSAKPLFDTAGQCCGWRGVASDVTLAQEARQRLTFLAHNDALTGVTNRHRLRDAMLEALQSQDGDGLRRCAVLCLDLDHFKATNDTLGHAAGDALLVEVARRLQEVTRHGDLVGRLGGDEFVLVLLDVDEAQTGALIQRLQAVLQRPFIWLGSRISVRASIGVALGPRDGADIDALLQNADLALYQAKAAGRAAYRFFAPHMAELTRRRLALEQGLRDALAKGEMRLEFQPQIDVQSWRVQGFEALLRWQHPQFGEVSPAEFIPIAEDAGLIQPIGAWVLQQACRHASGWPAGLKVSVNVSPAQAMSHSLRDTVRSALATSGLQPAQLELEITESIFIHDPEVALEVLRGLQQLGLRIALDDFGTGYSSLAYLRRFPFDTLKIDRAFVAELTTRSDARAIVKTILTLAHTLRMTTVAEGIEEPIQVDLLQRYGCHAIQGFLVSESLPSAQVPQFLDAWRSVQRAAATAPATLETSTAPL